MTHSLIQKELYLFWYGLHFFPLSNELRKHRAWRWDVEMCGREPLELSRYKWVRNGAGECWGGGGGVRGIQG